MMKKRAFTLLEIMIVIFLIGLIGSIVGYSMKGSLEEGKAFKTKQAQIRIKDLLELALARGATPEQINGSIKGTLESQNIVKNVDNLMKDGWGKALEIKVNADGDITVKSTKLDAFEEKKNKDRGYAEEEL